MRGSGGAFEDSNPGHGVPHAGCCHCTKRPWTEKEKASRPSEVRILTHVVAIPSLSREQHPGTRRMAVSTY